MKTTQARRLAWPAASAALAVALAVLAGSGEFATSQAVPANGAAMADAIAASRTVAEVSLICTCTEYKTGYYGPRCVKHAIGAGRSPGKSGSAISRPARHDHGIA